MGWAGMSSLKGIRFGLVHQQKQFIQPYQKSKWGVDFPAPSRLTMKQRVKIAARQFQRHGGWIFAGLLLIFISGAFAVKQIQERKRVSLPSVQSGPWGDMLVWNVQIQQPEEYLGFFKQSSEGPFWNFGAVSEKEVESTLSVAGFSVDQIRELLATRVPSNVHASVVLQPSEKFLLSMDKKTRANLYLKLAAHPQNFYQANPLFDHEKDLECLIKGNVSNHTEILRMYEKLTYERNGYSYFSDPEIILRKLDQDPGGRAAFLKFLTTIDAVMASILVKPDSQIDLPVMYWGLPTPGLRVKDLYPLFEAQKSLPSGGAIPVSSLLPEKARELLYKTPLATTSQEAPPDCHVAALSFFSQNPDPRLNDTKYVARYLTENYYEIGKPSLTGDLILLVNSRNILIHSAVHLAGDIVFSKNGTNIGQPWVLMHEKDMIGLFSALEPVSIRYMRWNQL